MSSRAWLTVGPLLGLLLWAPTLGGTFLSDDHLVNTMLTHDAEPRLAWSEILADFTREWAGLERSGLYRPLVTLTFALCYAIDGMDPLPFHAVNVLIHVLASLACAIACRAIAPGAAAFAGAVGGAVFALHPVAAEPTGWIAARTTGLQVLFGLWCLALFALYLRGRRTLGASALCLVLSLLSKESAVVLPFGLLFLDLLDRGLTGARRPLSLRFHGVAFALLALYFLLRRAVLGAFLGGAEDELLHGASLAGNLRDKLAMLVAPVGNGIPEPLGYVVGFAVLASTAVVLLPALQSARHRPWLGLGLLWIALHFAPTARLPVSTATLGGSRMVYDAAGAFAIVLGALGACGGSRRRAASLVLLGALAISGLARMQQYRSAYAAMRSLRVDLTQVAGQASVAAPLAFVHVAAPATGIPFLNCNAMFPLVERPVAQADTPAVGLGFTFQPVPGSETLLFDVGPMRAMRELGALLLEWDPESPAGVVVRRRPDGKHPALPEIVEERPGWFLAKEPLDPWAVEALTIAVADACGGRVEWLLHTRGGPSEVPANPPQLAAAAPHAEFGGRSIAQDGGLLHYVDLSHLLTFVAVERHGRLAGFKITFADGQHRPARVTLLDRVEPLDLHATLAGGRVTVAGSGLRAPEAPGGASAMTLYLIGPDTTLPLAVAPGAPVDLAPLARSIRPVLRSSRQKRYYYCFEARGEKVWRSRVDWLVLQSEGSAR